MFLHRGVCMHQKSQQGVQPFKLPLRGLFGFYGYEHYMYIGGMSFKTLLKENYVIALDSCYLFTKKC